MQSSWGGVDNYLQKQPPEVFYKELFLNILQYSQKNAWVGVSFK